MLATFFDAQRDGIKAYFLEFDDDRCRNVLEKEEEDEFGADAACSFWYFLSEIFWAAVAAACAFFINFNFFRSFLLDIRLVVGT